MADKEFPFIKVGLAIGLVSSLNQSRAARNSARTNDEAERTIYRAWAAGDDVMNSVAGGMVLYGIYKRSPGWAYALGALGLVGSMFMKAEHVLGSKVLPWHGRAVTRIPSVTLPSGMRTNATVVWPEGVPAPPPGYFDQPPATAGWW